MSPLLLLNSLCFVSVAQTSSTPVKRGSIVCALLALHKLVPLLSLLLYCLLIVWAFSPVMSILPTITTLPFSSSWF